MNTHDGLCSICGERGVIRPGLVAWRVPVFARYENIDRCTDEEGCRARVKASGDPWPIMEPGERVRETA